MTAEYVQYYNDYSRKKVDIFTGGCNSTQTQSSVGEGEGCEVKWHHFYVVYINVLRSSLNMHIFFICKIMLEEAYVKLQGFIEKDSKTVQIV